MPDIAIVMPKMSMTMTEGEVVAWRRAPGEAIREGDVVAEVLTDKVEMEVESPVTGVLARLVADTGDRVPVGEPLAYVTAESDGLLDGLTGLGGDSGATPAPEDPPAAAADATSDAGASPEPSDATAAQRPVPPSRKAGTPALPGARRLAASRGVALESVTGTGPDGAITVGDVEAAAGARSSGGVDSGGRQADVPQEAGKDAPQDTRKDAGKDTRAGQDSGSARVEPAFADALAARRSQVRTAVASIMSASTEIPQFTVWRDLDLEVADRRRDGRSWTAVLLSAFARAVVGDPTLGGQPGSVHVSLAVDTPVGLLGPVVRAADSLSVAEVDAEVRAAAERARAGRLTKEDLAGGTTTFSNLGSWGVDSFSALLTPPQATALAVGAVGTRPVAKGRSLAVVTTCRVGLTVDHRAADGADAARVLRAMAALLGEERQGS